MFSSVTGRIQEIKQPYGGYVKPSSFEKLLLDDGVVLHEEENLHGTIIGLVVDYLTRLCMGTPLPEAFRASLKGAEIAESVPKRYGGIKNATKIAIRLLATIDGLDEMSIVNACKLVTFDAWLKNPLGASMAKGYKETCPDFNTVENIQVLVKRSLSFFEKYGPIVQDGFTFSPVNANMDDYEKMIKTGRGTFGGYTPTVSSGDGDFLTADTLWDFKVSKDKPKSKHTLQLLMYWIMGQHSGQPIYKTITKLGIFNPRLNVVYLLDVSNIPHDVIKTVEEEVICY